MTVKKSWILAHGSRAEVSGGERRYVGAEPDPHRICAIGFQFFKDFPSKKKRRHAVPPPAPSRRLSPRSDESRDPAPRRGLCLEAPICLPGTHILTPSRISLHPLYHEFTSKYQSAGNDSFLGNCESSLVSVIGGGGPKKDGGGGGGVTGWLPNDTCLAVLTGQISFIGMDLDQICFLPGVRVGGHSPPTIPILPEQLIL